jgi:hypothetical protein
MPLVTIYKRAGTLFVGGLMRGAVPPTCPTRATESRISNGVPFQTRPCEARRAQAALAESHILLASVFFRPHTLDSNDPVAVFRSECARRPAAGGRMNQVIEKESAEPPRPQPGRPKKLSWPTDPVCSKGPLMMP